MTAQVAIVGGGWAGLACGVELARHDIRTTVFEAAAVLGGRARRVDIDGRTVDNGQHILIGAYVETLRLLRLLGVSPKRFWCSPFEVTVPGELSLRAARLPAPLHLAVGLLRAKGLDWQDRRAAVRLLQSLKRCGFKLGGDMPVSALLGRTAQTPRMNRLLWEPLCVAALNTPAERASAQVFVNVLRDSVAASASASELWVPRVDLTELLPVPAAQYLSRRGGMVRSLTRIRKVIADEGSFRLEGDDWGAAYSHVVLAVPPAQVSGLTADFPELGRLRAQTDGFDYEAISTIYLAYGQNVALPRPMIALSGGVLQWAFDRGQLGGPAGLIAGVVSAARTGQVRDELALDAHREIERLLVPEGGRLPAPVWSKVITERRATFACTPSLSRPIARTPARGLLLAGDYVASDYPATLEGAVRSGLEAARMIIRDMGLQVAPRVALE